MVVVTPLKITPNFSRVRSAKDLSLANLPSQRLEKQSKSKLKQSKSTVTGTPTIYRKPFPNLYSFTLQDNIVSLSQSTMPTPKHYKKNPIPISLSISRLQEPF